LKDHVCGAGDHGCLDEIVGSGKKLGFVGDLRRIREYLNHLDCIWTEGTGSLYQKGVEGSSYIFSLPIVPAMFDFCWVN
jgi:hypothetical protein